MSVKIQFNKYDSLKHLCRSCKHSRVRRNIGMVCELTGEPPDFYCHCKNFELHKYRDDKIHLEDHEYQQNLVNAFLIIAFILGFTGLNFLFSNFTLSVVILMIVLLGYAAFYASRPHFVNRFGYAPYIYLILAGNAAISKKNKTGEELRIIQTQVLKMMGWTAIKDANDVIKKNKGSYKEAIKYLAKLKSEEAKFIFSLICEVYVYYNLNDFLKSDVLKQIAFMLDLKPNDYVRIKNKYETLELNHQKKLRDEAQKQKHEEERQKRQGSRKLYKKDIHEYLFVLGFKEDVTNEEIKKRFKKLALKYHPDKFIKNVKAQKKAAEKFKIITEAYNYIRRRRGF